MKYDELTLMKFVDGELDQSLADEIENARLKDEELQAYIEVYESTRSALIDSSQEETIPSHISDMIDNFSPVKKQNWLTKVITNNPFKTSIFSAILASFLTFQGLLIATGGMFTASQLATRGIEAAPEVESKALMRVNTENILNLGIVEDEINNALSINQNIKSVLIKIDDDLKTLYFLERFTDNQGNNCKVAQIDDQFLIICKAEDSPWLIKSY